MADSDTEIRGEGGAVSKTIFFSLVKKQGGPSPPGPLPGSTTDYKAQFLSAIVGHGTWHMLCENKRGRQTREEEDLLLINDKAMFFCKIPQFNIHSFYRAAHIHYQSLWR